MHSQGIYKDKIVCITGAGQGIGKHIAMEYAEQGAIIIAVDRNEEPLTKVVQQVISTGGTIFPYVVDISKPSEIEGLFLQIKESLGTVHILINNAGFGAWISPYELTLDDWDDVINTNLRGTFLCAREAASLMKDTGGGAIINMSSTRALMSEPNSEAYAASKGGILSLTHALAVSLGKDQITVNAICPGWIENVQYDQLRDEDHDQHPAGRVGKPSDIVRACMYFTAPSNDFVTGTHLVVDCGMTRKMIYEE